MPKQRKSNLAAKIYINDDIAQFQFKMTGSGSENLFLRQDAQSQDLPAFDPEATFEGD